MFTENDIHFLEISFLRNCNLLIRHAFISDRKDTFKKFFETQNLKKFNRHVFIIFQFFTTFSKTITNCPLSQSSINRV